MLGEKFCFYEFDCGLKGMFEVDVNEIIESVISVLWVFRNKSDAIQYVKLLMIIIVVDAFFEKIISSGFEICLDLIRAGIEFYSLL